MKITINETSDWQKLKEQGLGMVVDPMVFRCGELFLKGIKDVEDDAEKNKLWDLLNANLHALEIFFDSLILNEKIPVFNYALTYDSHLNFDQRELTKINEHDDVLYDIDVAFEPYKEVKEAALTEVIKVYKGPHKISRNMVREILSELSAAEYNWYPQIDDLQEILKTEEEKRLAAFLLSGLIFSGYAQMLEGEHLLQPKRSRLFLAVSLQSESAGYKLEEYLFKDLKMRANIASEDLPWLPTFFPYLLSKADSPSELLREVVKLRKSSEIKDYRHWLGEVMEDWKRNGKIDKSKRKDVNAIKRNIDRKLKTTNSLPTIEMKATVNTVLTGIPSVSVDLTPPLQGLWGWVLSSIPGNRYRKLLTKAIIASHEYVQLENRMKTVWGGG